MARGVDPSPPSSPRRKTDRETDHEVDPETDPGPGGPRSEQWDEVGAMKSAEGRGRTLDEAVDAALIELGESRRNVDVRVISEGLEETVVEVSVIDFDAAPAASPAN